MPQQQSEPRPMKKVIIHSDGGCHGNPGPGGWAAVLEHGGRQREISGGEPATTNNRMELQAAIAALQALREPCVVEFFTDSTYVKSGVTSWIRNWKFNGWRTKAKQPVKNEDLWRALDAAASGHRIEWKWLKGHAGHVGNERCDELANGEIGRIKQEYTADQLRSSLAEFVSKSAAPETNEELFSAPATAGDTRG